jgi:hypothetical protein
MQHHQARRAVTASKLSAPTARRKLPSPSLPLLAWANIPPTKPAPDFDPQQAVRWAMGLWRASYDARLAIPTTQWCTRYGITLPDEIDANTLRFNPRLSMPNGERAPGLVWLLRDLRSDEPTGVLRTFLGESGEVLGQRVLGHGFNSAFMLDPNEAVESGLFVATSIERALRGMANALRPMWCVATEGALDNIDRLGIEEVTIID